MRPFLAQPRHPEPHAQAASHTAASTSSSGNLAAAQKRPAGSADASGGGSGSARLGKPPQPQAPPRKRPRVHAHPPSVHDVTGKATIIDVVQGGLAAGCLSVSLFDCLAACQLDFMRTNSMCYACMQVLCSFRLITYAQTQAVAMPDKDFYDAHLSFLDLLPDATRTQNFCVG